MSRPASSARRPASAGVAATWWCVMSRLRREVVGDDRAGEAELAAQQVVEDQLRSAARHPVDRRVGVHDGREAGFGDRGAERLGVDLAQLARAEVHRRVVHPAFGEPVAEEVLAGRRDAVGERRPARRARTRRPSRDARYGDSP